MAVRVAATNVAQATGGLQILDTQTWIQVRARESDLTAGAPTTFFKVNYTNGGYVRIGRNTNSSGDVTWESFDGTDTVSRTFTGVTATNTWHCYATVLVLAGGSTKTLNCYVDGVLLGQATPANHVDRGDVVSINFGPSTSNLDLQDYFMLANGNLVSNNANAVLRLAGVRVPYAGTNSPFVRMWFPFMPSAGIAAPNPGVRTDYSGRGWSIPLGTTLFGSVSPDPAVGWGGTSPTYLASTYVAGDGATATTGAAAITQTTQLTATALTQTAGSAAIQGFGSTGGAGGFGGLHRRGALTRRPIR